ncbi:MAG: carboxypeptidase regulatory-like domain-containing protein [Acidobacteria bacterium]|nr:carboxypeptidase regulatory-like domain-containing protein [Acidobacteriota bacterium]MBI3425490.1 carboxypeptidase regulatory-like domain-containing protein [Acidobacteriota bacterium]
MNTIKVHNLVTIVFLLLVATLSGLAQTSGSASLRGTVTDPTGAVVAQAKVLLRDEQTQQERTATTNEDGLFSFTALTPGVFTVKVEGVGFKVYSLSKFLLSPSETRGLSIKLEIGAATESVTVTGEAAQIQTETGEKAYTITASQIENLSLISRSSLELLRILPGVVGPDAETLDFTGFQQGGNANNGFSVNGQRGQNINISIDGSITKDVGANNGTIVTPNNDMVKEVRVQTSNYAAEFGTSTLQVTAVTKSGGKQFHGSLYEYARHYSLNANDRARNYSALARPQSSQFYTGGNLGGPIKLPATVGGDKVKDRLFFFYGFEYQRQRNPQDIVFGVVPTLKQRQGDFSEFLPCANIGNPAGCTSTYLLQNRTLTVPRNAPTGFTVGQSLVANNFNLAPFKDASNLGPTMLSTLFPAPNYTDPTGRFNYVTGETLPLDRTDQKLRVDYKVSERTNLYVRLARETEGEEFSYGVWGRSAYVPGYSNTLGDHIGRSAAANLVTVFDPTLTMEVVFSASKLKLSHEFKDVEKVSPQALGLSNLKLPFGNLGKTFPTLQVTGLSQGLTGGGYVGNFQGETPQFAFNSSYSVNGNVTKINGSHVYKFGSLLEQVNKKQNLGNQYNGRIVLGGVTNGTGNSFGNLYIGRPVSVQQSNTPPVGEFRAWNFDVYAQDAWKMKPWFTFEYGLRVVNVPNNKERNGLETFFDVTKYQRNAGAFINGDFNKPNGIQLVSRGEAKAGIVDDPAPRLAPRLSFAWDVSKKGNFVVRGGYGLFYNRAAGNFQYSPALQNAPNYINPTVRFDSAATAFKDGVQNLTLDRLTQVDLARVPLSITPVSLNPEGNDVTRTASSSLSIARRLGKGNVLEVGYVGNQVRHLPQVRNINFVPIGALLKGTLTATNGQVLDLSSAVQRVALSTDAYRQLLPFPDFNAINFREYVGTSAYHSGQLTLTRQQGKLTYTAAYTFSKALGIFGGDGGTVDPLDARNRSYGVQAYDRTHNLVVNYNYNLPRVIRGKGNRLASGLLNGWQLSGISTYQSGAPIRVFFSGGATGATGTGLNGANVWQSWFGTNAFAGAGTTNIGGIAPILLANPQINGASTNVGDKLYDVATIGIPAFGQSGAYQSPFYSRLPSRNNHDMTVMKNFRFKEGKNIQLRTGLFNIFNQAFVTRQSDVDMTLQTDCRVRVNGVPNGLGGTVNNVCDPTQGYFFNDTTLQNFGKVITKRGNRRVQISVRFTF